MGATTLVSVADYLSTSYSPDREYVDGLIVERNWGGKTHLKHGMRYSGYLRALIRDFSKDERVFWRRRPGD